MLDKYKVFYRDASFLLTEVNKSVLIHATAANKRRNGLLMFNFGKPQ